LWKQLPEWAILMLKIYLKLQSNYEKVAMVNT